MPKFGLNTYGPTIPYYYADNDTASISIGIDGADSNKLKITALSTTGAYPTTTAQIVIDPSTNGNVQIDPNGTGNTELVSGSLVVDGGNIYVPKSTSSVGVYYINSSRFIHNAGNVGDGNTFVGRDSGNFTLTGGTALGNTGLGTLTLNALTTGTHNTAIGNSALAHITNSYQNTAIGLNVMNVATSGCYANTGIGYQALVSMTTNAHNNTANGNGCLSNILTGSYNTAIGQCNGSVGAGNSYTGSESNNICIHNVGVVGESNVMRIGTSGSGDGQVNKCYLAGTYGVTPGGSTPKTLIMTSDGQIGTSGSMTSMWSTINANQTAAVNNGYFCNKAGTLALALPTTSAVGDVIEVVNMNTAAGIQFTQAAGQQIIFGSVSTTAGAGGTLTSTAVGQTLKMVCQTANLTWYVLSSIGNWTTA